MAKSYYSLEEACDALSMTEAQLKDLVRGGKLREFRDGAKVTYKAEDINKLAEASGITPSPDDSAGGSGELVLEPADDTAIDLEATGSETGIDLASTGSDIISLAETDSDATAVGDKKQDKKDDTVVTSVGVSVFEEDDTGVTEADPVAETVISDGGLGIEGIGSGSGLLDLTRESQDDTTLGAELLDEIHTGDMGEMGEATRAGLDQMVDEAPADDTDTEPAIEPAPVVRGPVVTTVEYASDPLSTGLTGLMGVGVLLMCLMGLSVAAMMHNAVPSLLRILYDNMAIFGGAAVALAGIATGVGFFLGKKAEQG
jgi:hypothetical protein